MKPAPFSYLRPATLAEALQAYAADPEAKILAGGQSLIPLLSMRLAAPTTLIDINGIPELEGVRADTNGVRFGATVRHTDLLEDNDARRVQPLLAKALTHVAHPTIRNRGTSLGSIVHADAAAELPAVLALLEGELTVASLAGTRAVAAAELFTGPLETSLAAGEIATEAAVPALADGEGVAFTEVARRNGDYALCGVAALVAADEFGAITSVRTSYLSVCDTPTVVDVSEVFMDGSFTDNAADEAAELAVASLDPQADVHASAAYRRHLARVLTARAVREAHDDCVARRTGVRT